MDDLIVFVRARLDEDEAAAKAARLVQAEWYVACDDDTVTIDALREHIGRLSPARVLREVAAGRAILARYGSLPSVTNLGEHLQRSQEQAGLDYTIRLLAAVWSDHAEYRPEWKP